MADSPKTLSLEFDGYWRSPNISSLPAASGVYCVYTCTHDATAKTVDLKKLVYIGESADIRGRVDGHPGWADWNKQLSAGQVLCVSAAKVSPSGDRERAEAAMIFKHQPPCNTSLKDSFPHDTTTISLTGKVALLTTSFTIKKGSTK